MYDNDNDDNDNCMIMTMTCSGSHFAGLLPSKLTSSCTTQPDHSPTPGLYHHDDDDHDNDYDDDFDNDFDDDK